MDKGINQVRQESGPVVHRSSTPYIYNKKLDTLPSSVRHIIYSICKEQPNDILLGEMIRAWASKEK